MAERWSVRVSGEGEGARAQIFAFSGLYFGGRDLRDASVKGIRYFNCLSPRGREEIRDPQFLPYLRKYGDVR